MGRRGGEGERRRVGGTEKAYLDKASPFLEKHEWQHSHILTCPLQVDVGGDRVKLGCWCCEVCSQCNSKESAPDMIYRMLMMQLELFWYVNSELLKEETCDASQSFLWASAEGAHDVKFCLSIGISVVSRCFAMLTSTVWQKTTNFKQQTKSWNHFEFCMYTSLISNNIYPQLSQSLDTAVAAWNSKPGHSSSCT